MLLKLKMPGPKGVITVNSSKQMALKCEQGDAAMAETACAQEELKFYKAHVDPEDNSVLKKPAIEEKMKFKSGALCLLQSIPRKWFPWEKR